MAKITAMELAALWAKISHLPMSTKIKMHTLLSKEIADHKQAAGSDAPAGDGKRNGRTGIA